MIYGRSKGLLALFGKGPNRRDMEDPKAQRSQAMNLVTKTWPPDPYGVESVLPVDEGSKRT